MLHTAHTVQWDTGPRLCISHTACVYVTYCTYCTVGHWAQAVYLTYCMCVCYILHILYSGTLGPGCVSHILHVCMLHTAHTVQWDTGPRLCISHTACVYVTYCTHCTVGHWA